MKLKQLDELLHCAADRLRGYIPINDAYYLQWIVDELLTKEEPGWGLNEEEFYGYMEELSDILGMVGDNISHSRLLKYIASMPWDNFTIEPEEECSFLPDTKYMTLGSMFYNKLTYSKE
jgi:hypothetical protein